MKNKRKRLTKAEELKICLLLETNAIKQEAIATEFGISQQKVSMLNTARKTYRFGQKVYNGKRQ